MALNVLLVEDTVGLPMSKVLKKWGYEVSLAVDGEDAWKQASENRFDCFLIDWMLPGISGIDLVQKLRQTNHCKNKAIVMISGRSGKEDIATAAHSGIDSYLAKPFTAVQLRDKVEEVVAARAAKKSSNDTQRTQRIQRIIKGHMRFAKMDETPYIILGEPANTSVDLQNKQWAHVVDYLDRAANAIEQANREQEGLCLDYVIATQADEVVDHVKSLMTRERICAVLLSVDFKGNALRLTRLLCANRTEGEFAVYLICNSQTDVPFTQQAELEELGVRICERADLNERGWQNLIAEQLSDS